MKSFIITGSLAIAASLMLNQSASAATWTKSLDGEMGTYKYQVIDPEGAVTRAECPYTCADRNIPKESCKVWRSEMDKNLCYVQDLRISKDDAMPAGGDHTGRKNAYHHKDS